LHDERRFNNHVHQGSNTVKTLTERTVIDTIAYSPATAAITITRALEVLRGDEVIHRELADQVIGPADDLEDLEPQVLAVAAAVWSAGDVKSAVSSLLEAARASHAQRKAEGEKMATDLEDQQRTIELSMEHAQRQSEALKAAHAELDVEHATLNARSDEVSRRRADLFEQGESLRATAAAAGAVRSTAPARPA
jgi:chromosome segregation ATPase